MIKIKQKPFTRIAPTTKTEELALGWFAISHRWTDDVQKRRASYGSIYKISSSKGSIYRNLKFSPRLKGSAKQQQGQILIDWYGWICLNVSGEESEPETLTIKKASILETFYYTTTHPDPAYRHSMALARMGLYISFMSIILAFK